MIIRYRRYGSATALRSFLDGMHCPTSMVCSIPSVGERFPFKDPLTGIWYSYIQEPQTCSLLSLGTLPQITRALWKPFESEFSRFQSVLAKRHEDIKEEMYLAERKAAYKEISFRRRKERHLNITEVSIHCFIEESPLNRTRPTCGGGKLLNEISVRISSREKAWLFCNENPQLRNDESFSISRPVMITRDR
jgi:hypothetical protein